MRPRAWLIGPLLLLAAFAPKPGAPPQPSQRITIFAAASLSQAFAELARRFEARHPGVSVQLNLAGSQQLAAQLLAGARADLFASADRRWMDRVSAAGLTASPPVIFARNRLVMVTPAANPAGLRSVAELARPGLKLVLADSLVPAGRYAWDALGAMDHEPEGGAGFRERVQRNVVSREENVKAVLAKVLLGEADAGIVYQSDASGAGDQRLRTFRFPPGADLTAEYPLAILNSGEHPDLGRRFVALVLSPEGQAILARHGFGSGAR